MSTLGGKPIISSRGMQKLQGIVFAWVVQGFRTLNYNSSPCKSQSFPFAWYIGIYFVNSKLVSIHSYSSFPLEKDTSDTVNWQSQFC